MYLVNQIPIRLIEELVSASYNFDFAATVLSFPIARQVGEQVVGVASCLPPRPKRAFARCTGSACYSSGVNSTHLVKGCYVFRNRKDSNVFFSRLSARLEVLSRVTCPLSPVVDDRNELLTAFLELDVHKDCEEQLLQLEVQVETNETWFEPVKKLDCVQGFDGG